MLVTSLGKTDAVKMMVAKKGIDLWVKDNEDKDLEEACPEFRRNEIVKLLKEAKQKPIIEKVRTAMPHTLPFFAYFGLPTSVHPHTSQSVTSHIISSKLWFRPNDHILSEDHFGYANPGVDFWPP